MNIEQLIEKYTKQLKSREEVCIKAQKVMNNPNISEVGHSYKASTYLRAVTKIIVLKDILEDLKDLEIKPKHEEHETRILCLGPWRLFVTTDSDLKELTFGPLTITPAFLKQLFKYRTSALEQEIYITWFPKEQSVKISIEPHESHFILVGTQRIPWSDFEVLYTYLCPSETVKVSKHSILCAQVYFWKDGIWEVNGVHFRIIDILRLIENCNKCHKKMYKHIGQYELCAWPISSHIDVTANSEYLGKISFELIDKIYAEYQEGET